MKYLIGMDGGGTKTACIATDLDGNVLYHCTGGPSNFLIIGTERVSEMLFSLITECKEKLNASYDDFGFIVLGTTGAGRRSDAEKLETAFFKYCISKGVRVNFYVDSDARIALEGAFSGNPGSIMIAGTGSIMFGKRRTGKNSQGWRVWEVYWRPGQGYVIGKKGLTMVAKHYDERGDHTLLTKLVAEKFNINSSRRINNPDI